MNTPNIARRIILLLVVAGLVAGLWLGLVSRSFVHLNVSGSTNHVTVADGQSGRVVIDRTSSGWVNVPTGSYVVTFRDGDQILSLKSLHVGPLSFQEAAPAGDTAALQTARPFLKYSTNLMTPLGTGYLYLDKATHGLSYMASNGAITDLTSRLHLTDSPDASLAVSQDTLGDTIINMQAVSKGGVVVTTTLGVFWVRSATDITELMPYTKSRLNYTASAYDANTNSVFVLPSYSPTIFRYDLGKPNEAPTIFYNGDHQLNRLAAGGGKLVASYDSVVSTDPKVLAEYDRTRQLTPLVFNTNDGSAIKKLTDYQAATYLSVSDSGQYLAIKRKFATTLTIYDLTSGRTATIPSYDLGGASWKGDTFFTARDKAIWSYDATNTQAALVRVADTAAPVTWLLATANQTIFSTNDNISYLLQAAGAKPPAIVTPPAPPARNYIFYAPPPEKS